MIPIQVSLPREGGGSYLAATVINGCVVTFEIYSPSAGAVDAGALSTLKTVLAGCYPAG